MSVAKPRRDAFAEKRDLLLFSSSLLAPSVLLVLWAQFWCSSHSLCFSAFTSTEFAFSWENENIESKQTLTAVVR